MTARGSDDLGRRFFACALLVGVHSYISGEIAFGVRPNTIGVERTGTIVIGEARWTVRQSS